MSVPGNFGRLFDEFKVGGITRRQFLERAGILGVGLPTAMFLANSVRVAGAPAGPRAGSASVAQDGAAARPAAGMEGRTRGEGGELKLLLWQAPTTMNPHISSGTKDFYAAQIVLEPMMHYLPDGTVIPNLIEQVPTVENGLLKEDLTGFTATTLEGLTWSDGTPFTAADVLYTWQWVTDPVNASVNSPTWDPIQDITAVDERTFTVTYAGGNLNWYAPFTGTSYGYILPKHILEQGGEVASNFNGAGLIGTGPYVVTSFSANDQVIYEANPTYREPNKPFFQTVNLKGGGDPASAARAVLQTGDWDYAWNLQVEPAILNELMESGENGTIQFTAGTNTERIHINFSDPNTEVNGERSQKDTPHPFLSDLAVRQAMALAVDRETIATQFYGEGEPATANIVNGLPDYVSPNTSFEFNLDKAKETLEAAGWVIDGDTRAKDGVELKITYATSINPVRQKTQAVNKQAFEEIGIQVSLLQVDSGIFFDSSPGNEQNTGHMYVDINMFTNGSTTPVPIEYMTGWYAGVDGANISQASNSWNGQNSQRWVSAEYDALFDQLRTTVDVEQAAQLVIQLNDILINEVVVIPEVSRAADKYAISNRLRNENVALSALSHGFWNMANWNHGRVTRR